MTFITKLSAVCAAITVVASSMSYAGTVTTTQLEDNYIGANGKYVSTKDYTPNDVTANYDIHWMQVAKTINGNQGSLTVTINSNFVAYNNDSKYKFGDLFIMDAAGYTQADACTDNKGKAAFGCNEYSVTPQGKHSHNTKESPNKWQYAFDLSGKRKNSYADGVNKNGKLKEIDQNNYANSFITTSSNRKWQAIMVNDRAVNTVGNGSWNTNIANKLLTMTFDISGTSLMGAAQLALRWQMTCANDIIEVVTNFKSGKSGPTPVPEPGTLMLMLLAGVGLFAARQKKRVEFKA